MKINKRKAQKDIYLIGRLTPDPTKKSGFRYTRNLPFKEGGDKVIVKAGETYYSWGIWGETKLRISTTYPNRNQLTISEYKLKIYDIEDKMFLNKDIHTAIEEIWDYIRELEDKVNRLPDHLQNKHVGKLLGDRIYELRSWAKTIAETKEPVLFEE